MVEISCRHQLEENTGVSTAKGVSTASVGASANEAVVTDGVASMEQEKEECANDLVDIEILEPVYSSIGQDGHDRCGPRKNESPNKQRVYHEGESSAQSRQQPSSQQENVEQPTCRRHLYDPTIGRKFKEVQMFGYRMLPPGRAVPFPRSTMRCLQEALHNDGYHCEDGYLITINPDNVNSSLINRIPKGSADHLCKFLAVTSIDNMDTRQVTMTEDKDYPREIWRRQASHAKQDIKSTQTENREGGSTHA